jgi:hypothetical protein
MRVYACANCSMLWPLRAGQKKCKSWDQVQRSATAHRAETHLIYQTLTLRAKFMGRSSVPPTGQHIMGLVTNFHSPFSASFPSAAPRRRCTAAPSLRRLWQASSRVAPPGAAASVAPPPCRNRSWASYRPRMERPSLVPGRDALRPRFLLRAYSHTALDVGLNRLRPASSAATRAWQSTGLTLVQSVLGDDMFHLSTCMHRYASFRFHLSFPHILLQNDIPRNATLRLMRV